jgi:4-amino-4-deoxy-L-arabinose transferase-like glycosyltransferase
VPANLQSDGEMLAKGIGVHVLGRALAPMQGHGAASLGGWVAQLPYYLPVVVIGFFPWTLFLPGGLAALARGRIGDPTARALLWAWIVPAFVLFSLAATKLPHYVLPIFPGVAVAWGGAPDGIKRPWAGLVLVALFGLAVAGGLLAAPQFLPAFAAPGPRLAVAVAFCLPAALALLAVRQGKTARLVPTFGFLAMVMFAGLWWLILPAAEPGIKLSREIAAALAGEADPGTRLYTAGYDEPSLVFYANLPAGRVIAPLPGTPGSARWCWTIRRGCWWWPRCRRNNGSMPKPATGPSRC